MRDPSDPQRTRILLDTDLAMGAPGSDIDDGFALALALAEPQLAVELVTAVHGNTDVATAAELSRRLLERLGRPEIPVVAGAGAPLPEAAPRDGEAAAAVLAERVLASPGELTIVAIGPLTNVALALELEPRLASAVARIVVMGGVFLGHTNVAAMPGEFNIWCDPHAAAAVLACGAPLRFVGLDVTRQVRLTRAHAARMAAGGGAFGPFAGECTVAWIDHQRRCHPGDPVQHDSCAMHDPLAVAVVTRPELVTWRPAHVAVETASPVTRGITVADLLTSVDPPAPNCEIATAVDAASFTDLFLDRLGELK